MQDRASFLLVVVVAVVSFAPSAVAEDDNGSYFSRESALHPTDGTVYTATKARPGAAGKGAVWAFHARPTCTQGACSPLKWVFTGAGAQILSPPAVGPDGTVYVGADDGGVYALPADPATPDGFTSSEYRWRFQTMPSSQIWGGAVVDENAQRLYIGSMRGKLYAFDIGNDGNYDPASGADYDESGCGEAGNRCLWAFSLPCSNGPCDNSIRFNPLIGPNGLVYAGTDGNGLFAVRPTDLSAYSCPGSASDPLHWSGTVPGPAWGVCVLWQFKSHGTGDPRGVRLGGAMDAAGQTLYVNDAEKAGGTVWALETSNDADRSRCVLGPDPQTAAGPAQDPRCVTRALTFGSMLLRNRPVLDPDGPTLYVASRNTSIPPEPNGLYALDVTRPWPPLSPAKWDFHPPQEFSYSFAAVRAGLDRLFIGGTNGKLYALGTDDGQPLWELDLEADAIRSTPIISHDTTQVYVGGRDRTFFAVDALNASCGCERWRFDTNDPTLAWAPSPPCGC
jgi:outer membrane protein assembly factor BamB